MCSSDLTPSEIIYDQYEEMAFAGHPLAHNILGNKRNVRHFTPMRLRQHLEQNYTPERMVITVSGDVKFERLVHYCERYFGNYRRQAVDNGWRKQKPVFRQFERHVNRRTHQAHLLIGCEAPDIYSTDKTAFTMLNNILGGPAMNSRLNVAIRERYGFCYTIESQYVPFSDTGLFYIYAGVDLDAEERALQLIRAELNRIAATPLTTLQLRQAQRQFIGQMAINNDNGNNEMQSIGKAHLCFDHVDTIEEMNADILRLTTDDLCCVAQKHFAPDKFSTLIYGN